MTLQILFQANDFEFGNRIIAISVNSRYKSGASKVNLMMLIPFNLVFLAAWSCTASYFSLRISFIGAVQQATAGTPTRP